MNLEAKIHETLQGDYAFMIDGKVTLSYNKDTSYNPASIIKLFILYAGLKAVDLGRFKLDELIHVPDEEIVPGAGVIQILRNRHYSYEDLLTLMIAYSDNTATNKMIELLSTDYIQNHIEAIGVSSTFVRRKLYHMIPGIFNESTASDANRMLKYLFEGHQLSEEMTVMAREILSKQHYKNLSRNLYLCARCGQIVLDNTCTCGLSISEVDPIPIETYSKSGSITGHVHDACVLVVDEEPTYITVFTRSQINNDKTGVALAKIGQMIYQYIKEQSC